ncbi:dihydrolipoyl dehydrogenase [Acinetobacter qingfengensis]|uniref:Dihydrolipoyl dehydrogenase n=1 Tax=Acinetobacter qingfengensis TaxID=1262585 RepID=A0A1E7RFH3_9GAMM|nr:dihydrolipoyl dehydrogenase [Acinetobacter qingfengensis]KAA8731823.1 dihydrolipoyl dehydrogenase [Acinetobacter qingfengensis]OEY98053.1 dihydrolipoyl dehydrogenase [Acinetobacter qingfengensis]
MYDLIIIGAGTAGINAYKQAVRDTQNILIINDGPWDTTCARVGCMPSKVLISTANRLHDAKTANAVGLDIELNADTSKVMSHVRQLRDRFTAATLKDVENWPAKHKVSGKAHFVDANTIEVNGQSYQARSFILAVGSTPNYDQQWKKQLGDRLITTDQIFELPQLPERIAVIGSGVIAIELAQALHRLGVQVSIFARSKKVGSLSSPQLQGLAQHILTKELDIRFETLPYQVQRKDQQVQLSFKDAQNKPQDLLVDYLLVATGRHSLLESLKLYQIDSRFKDIKDLPIDSKTKQLGQLPIFVAGDAYTNTPIQHEAAHEGKKLVDNCLNYPQIQAVKTLTPLAIVFCSPEMASVGRNYQQLKQDKTDFVTGFVSFEKQGRALVLGKNQGAVEIYVDRQSEKILGAELFVHQAEHFAHLLNWMITEQVTLTDCLDKPFYHPTMEEGLRTALKHARHQLHP